ncbi:EAL domain-containing protein (putative c-di-GMP-specific phosphodiesterase class I)/GGDEF domain-containing protein [Sphingomonas naasensis]|uniref:GGDEF domain-containing protein n=1 Tax=Sphingomonas naasensis TaxID=1344951 RepID=A0A4S1W402_9SPHN|nr:bifunctional diguanylate cyclase/phosphodiesterase [Sphingomonas naasensis]NIJ19592.1 EAL domain-containing protein (putative c-di-GMP-specific phosphodiesterase class I)/GGDEF domain-containing protein [Sphingomonas naasensis]TGX37329.1 GGDEF domain-containing protein [Sphingomonas naasensis]
MSRGVTNRLMRRAYLPGGSDPTRLLRGGGLLLAAVTVGAGVWLGRPWLALAALAVAWLVSHLVLRRRLSGVAARLGTLARVETTDAWQALAQATDLLEDRLRAGEDRLEQRHALTGLPTREPLLARMEGDRAGTLALIALADFDRLCAFDPALADRTLRQFAARITRMLGAERLVAHVDRSHFALWLGPEVPAEQAEQQLAAMRYALGDAMQDGDRELLPEVRVHHAFWSAGEEAPQATLARVLAACATTAEGPAQVQRVDEVSAGVERERYALEQDLRGALHNDEFELRYQPQIDAASGRVSGAEALLRWNNPARGMISPALFVPVLESAGMIEEVGLWALNAACREAGKWHRLGKGPLSVAVNVSAHQLDRADLQTLIKRTLERHALRPGMLEIELTESAAAADIGRAERLFEALHGLGIPIAIDDFGTGFSSLSALRALAFDKIKIDRQFVTEVETRRDSQAICQSIIALARGLGIRVLAEGVERQEEYWWLRRHGCSDFQGYYFSPPLRGAAFQTFVRNHAALRERLALDARQIQTNLSERLAR